MRLYDCTPASQLLTDQQWQSDYQHAIHRMAKLVHYPFQCLIACLDACMCGCAPAKHLYNESSSSVNCAKFAVQVQQLAWQRIVTAHDMPYAKQMLGSWSLTEGSGNVIHEHIHNKSMPSVVKIGVSTCKDGQLGAVPIPSAHHTYSSVSNLVDCIPEQARSSSGPVWIHSSAPVEGELIMDLGSRV